MSEVEFYAITYSIDGFEYKESYETLEEAESDFHYYEESDTYEYAVLQYVCYEDGEETIEILDECFK